jgi:hypothetical protein
VPIRADQSKIGPAQVLGPVQGEGGQARLGVEARGVGTVGVRDLERPVRNTTLSTWLPGCSKLPAVTTPGDRANTFLSPLSTPVMALNTREL